MVITIGNSYSKVTGFDKETFKRLREALSYETDPNVRYFAGGLYPSRRFLMDKHGSFPTGLLNRVKAAVPNAKVVDSRAIPKPTPKPWVGVKPRPEQLEAATEAVLAGQAGIQAATGSGKSLIIALIAAKLGLRTLVVVPRLELKQQLKESLSRQFKGKSDFITVENIDNPKLKTMKDFDCLIIDEAHHSAAKTYRDLNKGAWTGIYYRFFLTATFYRNADHENLLFESICGEPVYSLTYKTARDLGYILPVEAYTIEIPKQSTDAYTWAQVYSELVVNNSTRNQILADFMSQISDKFTLCLVKEIKHGEILAKLTGIPFANGQTEGSSDLIKDLCSGKLKQLIATTGVCAEGVDTVPAEYIIVAGLGKAKSAFMQLVGRGVRPHPTKESCKVILIQDKSHRFTMRHYSAQKKILLDDFGVLPIKLDIGGIDGTES